MPDDRNACSRILEMLHDDGSDREDHIRLRPHYVARHLRQAVVSPLARMPLDHQVLSLGKALPAQLAKERREMRELLDLTEVGDRASCEVEEREPVHLAGL